MLATNDIYKLMHKTANYIRSTHGAGRCDSIEEAFDMKLSNKQMRDVYYIIMGGASYLYNEGYYHPRTISEYILQYISKYLNKKPKHRYFHLSEYYKIPNIQPPCILSEDTMDAILECDSDIDSNEEYLGSETAPMHLHALLYCGTHLRDFVKTTTLDIQNVSGLATMCILRQLESNKGIFIPGAIEDALLKKVYNRYISEPVKLYLYSTYGCIDAEAADMYLQMYPILVDPMAVLYRYSQSDLTKDEYKILYEKYNTRLVYHMSIPMCVSSTCKIVFDNDTIHIEKKPLLNYELLLPDGCKPDNYTSPTTEQHGIVYILDGDDVYYIDSNCKYPVYYPNSGILPDEYDLLNNRKPHKILNTRLQHSPTCSIWSCLQMVCYLLSGNIQDNTVFSTHMAECKMPDKTIKCELLSMVEDVDNDPDTNAVNLLKRLLSM